MIPGGDGEQADSGMRVDRHQRNALALLALLLLMSSVHAVAGYSHAGVSVSGHAWGTDDAYISYRYAKNLVEGHGLVFNPGERVEGYSNFLYVLLMSLVFAVSDQHAYLSSVVLNLVFIAIAFLLFYRCVNRQFGSHAANVAGLLFALCPPVWLWVASGMETPLVILVTLGMWMAVETVAQTRRQSGVMLLCTLMVLSILTRADGFVAPLIAIAYLLLKRQWPAAAWCGATVLASMAAYTLWRYEYYGYLLPNTYYAKVSGPLGARLQSAGAQLWKVVVHRGLLAYFVVFLLVICRAAAGRIRRSGTPSMGFASVFAAGWIVYWFYIGGDVFEERFLVILVPLGIYELLRVAKSLGRGRALGLVVGLVLLHQLSCVITDPRFGYSLAKYDRWIELGQLLGERHSGRTLAIDAAGKVPFFSGLPTLDMLGLTNEFIAHKPVTSFQKAGHDKFDAQYVLGKHPDLIAAWAFGGRDLAWGLTRERYEGAGYRLRYLVNAKKEAASNPPGNIVDVSGADGRTITGLINGGYWYAVLERNGR